MSERTTQQLRAMTAQERAGYWAIRAGDLAARLAAVEAALRWYADEDRYRGHDPEILTDVGVRALTVLPDDARHSTAVTALDALRAERDEAQRALALVGQQVDLYEMSRSDPVGLDPESTIVCIANILETGHPARAVPARTDGTT